MAHALLMQPLEPTQHLPHVDTDQMLGEGAKVLNQRRQRTILHVLEHQIEVVLRADRLEVAHDLIMLQIVQQVDLRLHRLEVADRHVPCGDLLDRAKVTCLSIKRAVDLAGATAPELFAQLL